MSGKKIIIIDDSREITDVYGTLLQREGYEVQVANTGGDGLRLVHRNPPDLIILDGKMPDMDGNEVLVFMGADARLSGVPIIFLSGLVPPGKSGMKSNGVTYLSKLADFDAVLKVVKEELAKQQGAVPPRKTSAPKMSFTRLNWDDGGTGKT
jgi:DNA-binding response OmpR family regulator